MLKNFTRGLLAVVATVGIALPAAATTYSTDWTDLWGTTAPLESGWGMNVIQQGDVIFVTMFVYGADNSARWYSASELAPSNGGNTWSGTLYETRGPYFGSAGWDNAAVTRTPVGNMTLNFNGANGGTVQYSVNGVSVSKNITRFSLRTNNLAGNYLGGLTAKCSNGVAILIFDNLTVTQTGSTVGMQVRFYNASGVLSQCNFNGTMTPAGRLASISGNFTCSGGVDNNGPFTMSGVDASTNGFHGTFTGSDNHGCSMSGRFGGVKDVL